MKMRINGINKNNSNLSDIIKPEDSDLLNLWFKRRIIEKSAGLSTGAFSHSLFRSRSISQE